MKLTHVFGLVVAVHVAALTVIFTTPGCRSTGKPKPRPEDTDPAVASSSVTPIDTVAATPVAPMSYGDVNAAADAQGAAQPVTSVTPISAVADVPGATVVGVRFAPTRPVTSVTPITPSAVSTAAAHVVGKGDSLWSIAKKYGITVDELAAANQLSKSATLRLGQSLAVPAKAAGASAPGFVADAANTYVVKSGDTLGGISKRQGTTVAALRTANNLSGDSLRVGQKLVIPSAAARSASGAVETAAPHAGAGSYTVVAGDSLGSIARRGGVKVGDLALLNNITDPAKLRVGQVLKLPAGAKAIAVPVPAAASPASSVPPHTQATLSPPVEALGTAPAEPITPVPAAAVPVVSVAPIAE